MFPALEVQGFKPYAGTNKIRTCYLLGKPLQAHSDNIIATGWMQAAEDEKFCES